MPSPRSAGSDQFHHEQTLHIGEIRLEQLPRSTAGGRPPLSGCVHHQHGHLGRFIASPRLPAGNSQSSPARDPRRWSVIRIRPGFQNAADRSVLRFRHHRHRSSPMARNMAPGKNRRFAFTDWPNFDSPLWQGIYKEAAAKELAECPPILASDRDEGAIRISTANAERAGVLASLDLKCQTFSEILPPEAKGWIVTNPPYGVRVSASKDLRNLYSHLGDVLRQKCAGWHASILCSDPILAGHTHLKFRKPSTWSMAASP